MVILFSGWKGSGKDTCANYLIEKHNAVRVAMADPLKDLVAQEYGVDRATLDDPKRKEKPLLNLPVEAKDDFTKTVTKFMFKEFRGSSGEQPFECSFNDSTGNFQGHFLATDGLFTTGTLYHTPRSLAILKGSVNRVVSPNFWTDKVFEQIQTNLDAGKIVVVSDLRYRSELTKFDERFGKKAVFIRVNRFNSSPSSDPSERDLDNVDFDHYIDNTGSLENTFNQIEKILKSKT